MHGRRAGFRAHLLMATDNVVRVTADAVGHRSFTVRTKYDHAERRGRGIEEGELELGLIYHW